MIEIKLDDRKIKVDEELTIKKYQEISKNPIKYNDNIEILSLYLDIPTDELKELPYKDVKFIEAYLTQKYTKDVDKQIVFTFNYKGVDYGLENDWKNMTWGQWITMEVISQPDRISDNIANIMALLYRPIKSQNGTKYTLMPYKEKEVEERKLLFQELPIKYWFGAATFFFLIVKIYTQDIKSSLDTRNRVEKLLKPMRRILPKWAQPKPLYASTFNSLMNSQIETLLK
jgi:hypothetical protein